MIILCMTLKYLNVEIVEDRGYKHLGFSRFDFDAKLTFNEEGKKRFS